MGIITQTRTVCDNCGKEIKSGRDTFHVQVFEGRFIKGGKIVCGRCYRPVLNSALKAIHAHTYPENNQILVWVLAVIACLFFISSIYLKIRCEGL